MKGAWRYLYRFPWALGHVLLGVVLSLLLLNPLSGLLWDVRSVRIWLIPWWARGFLRVFNLRVRVSGEPKLAGAVLFASNHLSWVDVVVLHSIRLMAFIAKSEIRWWPLVGWMARQGNTIYHNRVRPSSLLEVNSAMAERLRMGGAVGLFPEGGVSNGKGLMKFHGSLIQSAIDAGAPVQPVALRYVEADGSVDTSTPFLGGEVFLMNMMRLMRQPRTAAEVHFCEPLNTQGKGRSQLAREAHGCVSEALSR